MNALFRRKGWLRRSLAVVTIYGFVLHAMIVAIASVPRADTDTGLLAALQQICFNGGPERPDGVPQPDKPLGAQACVLCGAKAFDLPSTAVPEAPAGIAETVRLSPPAIDFEIRSLFSGISRPRAPPVLA
ncbi:MAG: hypothetical protein KJZ73_12250 [Pseudorhodoplanes sp.]|nr:hypothetical protein [Pseudorhodoplanes sp.]MBW7950109.1 hypothetical protein [Pseudorhodoplanes sp.]MCL4712006.1 hypothetical protein [Pseudorhodoplanes sp.]MCQ3941992.1 hypothetical protein [Alphaproteobacteria bacterium]GIK79107.1 MAG: hypothetical protein BroJett024_02120 [Alphaproteobacteria bacterium]